MASLEEIGDASYNTGVGASMPRPTNDHSGLWIEINQKVA